MTNKTIAAGNVVLKMKADGVLAEANKIKNEMRTIRTIIKQSTPDTTRYAAETKALAEAFKRGDINGGQYARSQEFLAQKYKVLSQAQKESIALAEKEAAIRAKFVQKANLDAAWRNASGSVGISQITKQAQLQKEAVDRLNTAWRNAPVGVVQLTKQAQLQKEAVDRLNAAWKNAASVVGSVQFTKAAAAARSAYTDLVLMNRTHESSMKGKVAAAGSMLTAMRTSSAVMLAEASVIAAFVAAASKSTMLATSMEKARIQYGSMLGSMKEGNKLFDDMLQMTRELPIQLSDIQESAKLFLAFGVESAKVMPMLKRLGDITAGDSQRIQSMSLAYAQMSAAGRMMGQDLLQMINAGFNPLKEISDRTGISLLELKRRMEDGQISSKLIELAFVSATDEGGRFFNLLENQKGTLSGQWIELKTHVRDIAAGIGEGLVPQLKTLVQEANSFLKTMKEIQQSFEFNRFGKEMSFGLSQIKAFTQDNWKGFTTGIGTAESTEKLINSEAERVKREYEQFEAERQKRKKDREKQKEFDQKMLQELNGGGVIRQGMNQILETSKSIKYVWDEMLKDAELTKKKVEEIRDRANPDLKIQREAMDINQLLKSGLISQFEADKVLTELASQLQKGKASDGPMSPSLINADSSEAYRWVMSQQDQAKKLEEQKRIQAQQLQVLKNIMKNTENMPVLGVAG